MQSIVIFLGIALVFSVILSNFLGSSNKRKGEDFNFKEFIREFNLKNIDIKYVFIFFILFEILSKFIPFYDLVFYIPVVFGLILAFCLDLKYMIIPDTSGAVILISGIINLISEISLEKTIDSIIGLILGGMVFYIINKISEIFTKQTGFGFGDIKLLAAIGMFLGYKDIIVIMIMSVFISAAFSIVFLIVNKIRKIKEEYLPFGPFIVISTLIICIIPGAKIIDMYIYLIDSLINKLI